MGGTLPKNKLPANIPTDIGECRGVDQYVLVPGCYVPCSEEELLKKVEAKEINLFGCMHDFKKVAFSEFLRYNGFEIVDDDEEYCDFEYSDCKAYLDLEIKRQAGLK